MAYLPEFNAMYIPTSPISFSRRRLLQGLIAAFCWGAAPWLQAAQFSEITWDELVPSDWNPMKSFQNLPEELAELPDSDPQVQALYDRLRKIWDEAPTISSFEGRAVKIPGFIVPLEGGKEGLREFLLVPYFGACIHTPPPPANQIIHVKSNSPVQGFQSMSSVWVSGIMHLMRSNSALGVSGYGIQAEHVEEYYWE